MVEPSLIGDRQQSGQRLICFPDLTLKQHVECVQAGPAVTIAASDNKHAFVKLFTGYSQWPRKEAMAAEGAEHKMAASSVQCYVSVL